MEIRRVTPGEVEAVHQVVAAAGLSVTLEQFAFYVELEPEGYVAAWEGGEPIGSLGAVRYEGHAFLGGMVVRPDRQGRGVGRALLAHVLGELERGGVELALLEATDAGFPLYRSFGFVEAHRTVLYRRAADGESDLDCQLARDMVEPLTSADLEAVVELDARAAGARRGGLLAALAERHPGRAFVARGRGGQLAGYAIASRGRVGPWVASEPTAAEALLDAALTLEYDGAPTVALPGPNSAGAALLLRASFDAQRSTRRMWRGPRPPEGAPELMYGLAAMGLG